MENAERTTAAGRGKQPATRLAGPYGHPFHPILATVPIGAWVASLVFDVISRVGDDGPVFAKGAWWLILIGVAGALAAAVFGFLDLLAIPGGTPAFRTALTHMALNLVVVTVFVAQLAVRHGDLDDLDGTAVGPLVASVVGLTLLGVSGWLGGKLSYRFGVRVADDATQLEGFQR